MTQNVMKEKWSTDVITHIIYDRLRSVYVNIQLLDTKHDDSITEIVCPSLQYAKIRWMKSHNHFKIK